MLSPNSFFYGARDVWRKVGKSSSQSFLFSTLFRLQNTSVRYDERFSSNMQTFLILRVYNIL
jgi:hypothetical protein